MNLLLFETHELSDSYRLSLSGRRAEHLRQVLRVKSGDRVRVGEVHGSQGWAEVDMVSDETVHLRLESDSWGKNSRTEFQRPPLRMFVALPRPQSFKKVLQISSAMGVSELVFINSARVEQSFFLSPVLGPESIKEHLLLGLEQAGSTALPQVEIWKEFSPSRRNILHSDTGEKFKETVRTSDFRGLPEPKAAESLLSCCRKAEFQETSSAVFLLGPEGGWRDAELEFWQSEGFAAFSLGDWVLRVETALSVLVGQLSVMRELQQKVRKL